MISGRYQDSSAKSDATAPGPTRIRTAMNRAAPSITSSARDVRILGGASLAHGRCGPSGGASADPGLLDPNSRSNRETAARGRLVEGRENDDVLAAFCPLDHAGLLAEDRSNDGGQVVSMPVTVDIGHILGGRRPDLRVLRQLGVELPMLDPIDRVASEDDGAALSEDAQRGLEVGGPGGGGGLEDAEGPGLEPEEGRRGVLH